MKRENYRNGVVIICTLLIYTFGFSQNRLPVSEIGTEWTFFKEANGIKFHTKKEVQPSKNGNSHADYVLVMLENTTNKELTVSYTLAVHYNLGCNGCNGKENTKTYVIPANSKIEGTLSDFASPIAMLLQNYEYNSEFIPEFISTENLIIK